MRSKREQAILDNIKEWEAQLVEQEATDFQKVFDKWLHTTVAKLPEKKRKEFFTKADGWLFHLHAFIQSSQAQLDARNRILGTSRLFDESIEQLEDLKALSIDQLTYIAEQTNSTSSSIFICTRRGNRCWRFIIINGGFSGYDRIKCEGSPTYCNIIWT